MKGNGTTNKEVKKLTVPVNIGSDHILGSVNAPLNIVEYGDYECPYTGMAYPIVKEIVRQFGHKLYFVFRNFPLNDILPHAQMPLRPQRPLHLKVNSGKCMIICLNIKKH